MSLIDASCDICKSAAAVHFAARNRDRDVEITGKRKSFACYAASIICTQFSRLSYIGGTHAMHAMHPPPKRVIVITGAEDIEKHQARSE